MKQKAFLEGAAEMLRYIWGLSTPEGMGVISLSSDGLPDHASETELTHWKELWQGALTRGETACDVAEKLYTEFIAAARLRDLARRNVKHRKVRSRKAAT
jgi:hypothetical protein